jgi:predicted metalloprotease with PDZ domain
MDAGAVLTDVLAGTPAAESGLRAGDCIVSVDGRPIGSASDLTDRLDRIPARTIIHLGVLRGKALEREKILLSLRTASRPIQRQLAQVVPAPARPASAPFSIPAPTASSTLAVESPSGAVKSLSAKPGAEIGSVRNP